MKPDTKTYDLKAFIEQMVLPDLKKMVEQQLHYYAFAIICQAIEVMGSVFDQNELDDFRTSETRFDNAITNLFRNNDYKTKQHLFYSVLRGPLIHQLRPGPNLFLSSEQKDKIERKHHLKGDDEGRTMLVIEQFYDDFKDAFENFCRELDRRSDLDNKKVVEPFICVTHTSPKMDTSWWDKESKSLFTITPSITGRANL